MSIDKISNERFNRIVPFATAAVDMVRGLAETRSLREQTFAEQAIKVMEAKARAAQYLRPIVPKPQSKTLDEAIKSMAASRKTKAPFPFTL